MQFYSSKEEITTNFGNILGTFIQTIRDVTHYNFFELITHYNLMRKLIK